MKQNIVKYATRYILFFVVLMLFSQLISYLYYHSFENETVIQFFMVIALTCILWLFIELILKYILFKFIKIKTTFLKVHEYFAWSYMLRYVVGSILFFIAFEYNVFGNVLSLIADTFLILYQLYVVKTKYDATKKQYIIYFCGDIALRILFYIL